MTIPTTDPTRYEIVAKHPDGRQFLVCYAAGSPSRPRLLDGLRKRGEHVVRVLGVRDEDTMRFATKPRIHCTIGDWWIGFTGRTQRDAQHAPIPYIGAQ